VKGDYLLYGGEPNLRFLQKKNYNPTLRKKAVGVKNRPGGRLLRGPPKKGESLLSVNVLGGGGGFKRMVVKKKGTKPEQNLLGKQRSFRAGCVKRASGNKKDEASS